MSGSLIVSDSIFNGYSHFKYLLNHRHPVPCRFNQAKDESRFFSSLIDPVWVKVDSNSCTWRLLVYKLTFAGIPANFCFKNIGKMGSLDQKISAL